MEDKRLTISVEAAAKRLGISRSLAYDMAKSGRLPTIKFSRRLLVPTRALETLIDEAEKAALAAGK